MNILPKKRWHVRTKDNIARVRKDEAEAQKAENVRLEKQSLAESEARIDFLRSKAGSSCPLPESSEKFQPTSSSSESTSKHVDLFSDYKSFIKKTNDEHIKEKKEEQEKYEKQIGYLTYLGQDTNEALKLKSWYEVAPDRTDVFKKAVLEKDMKAKYLNDPLTLIKTLLPDEVNKPQTNLRTKPEEKGVVKKPKKEKSSSKEKKHKNKKKKHKSSRREEEERKRELLDRLRRERLKREAREKARQDELINPPQKPKETPPAEKPAATRIVQKYNSQFNPELAKQNMN